MAQSTANRIEGVPGRFWHRMDDGRLQCDLCPRFCRLHDGQRGLCFVRGRAGEQILLATYGRSSGFCIDPIEKKPLNHFLPGTPVLSFGTAGCNLACKFCQNWDLTRSRELDRAQERASPQEIAANLDLKAFSERFYWKICGGHLQPVLETLEYVTRETATWLELTTLLIPGENDSAAGIEAMSRWVFEHLGADVPLHFSAFHPAWKMQDTPPTPTATLRRARAIALDQGLRYVYTGNVHDVDGSSTWCPGCGEILIGRDWYELANWNLVLEEGRARCDRCATPVPGVFEATPGHWGSRRQQIDVRH